MVIRQKIMKGSSEVCCCCGSAYVEKSENNSFFICDCCGHQWLTVNDELNLKRYATLSGRNSMPDAYLEKKLQERVVFLLPMIRNGMRILEVGCAEGELGKRLKDRVDIEYIGIELSGDSIAATKVLDRVIRETNVFLGEQKFDLIISFHVLEHIANPLAEVSNWNRMLKSGGRVVVEVPNQSGHPLIAFDQNPEHIHQFDIASLVTLMGRANFKVSSVVTECFESPSYIDSVRVVADRRRSDEEKNTAMISRILSIIDGRFDIYGVGGDFYNYINPLLNELPVGSLYDSELKESLKGGVIVQSFDMDLNDGRPILIASIRFQEEIKHTLLVLGVSSNRLFYLSEILIG